MKKIVAILVAFIAVTLLFSGCQKCILCTEKKSGYSTEYCGTSSQIKTFEKELKEEGSKVGQSWSCVDVNN